MRLLDWPTGDAMEQLADLINAVAALSWPALVAAFLYTVASPLKALIESREFNVEVAGFKVSVGSSIQKMNTELAEIKAKLSQLEPASATEPGFRVPTPPSEGKSAQETSTPARKDTKILWVDDKPQGNALEIGQLKSLGFEIHLAESTADGMRMIEEADPPYDLVLSDIGRTEDGTYQRMAGLELLRQIRSVREELPVLFYTTHRTAQLRPIRDAVDADRNAYATGSTTEVFSLINKVIRKTA